MKRINLNDLQLLAIQMATEIRNVYGGRTALPKAFAIPRGGIPAALAVRSAGSLFTLIENPAEADFFIDDLIDSGATLEKWCDEYPGKPFFALIDKRTDKLFQDWIVFPWENDPEGNHDDTIVGTIRNRIVSSKDPWFANDNISRHIYNELEMDMLQSEVEKRVGHLLDGLLINRAEDHNTQNTPARVARMYLNETMRGRFFKAPSITSFPNVKKVDEMYLTGPITVRSMCSHHMVPISGKCWIGVVPGEQLIGLSKFNRIVDWACSRPQIQEELTTQIADFLEETITPKGLAVVIQASHMCMTLRGVKEPENAKMTTSVMRGAFACNDAARAEFTGFWNK